MGSSTNGKIGKTAFTMENLTVANPLTIIQQVYHIMNRYGCSTVSRDFLGILLVTYLMTPKVTPWWVLRGEKKLKLCPSRTLENAFSKMFSIAFCNGERQRKTKCLITIPWRVLYFLPNRCLEISVYMSVYM